MGTFERFSIVAALLALSACATTREPGIEVRTVEVVKEVPRDCPGTVPTRPAPLGPLPTDLVALAATLGAKLAEYSDPGQYADQAEAYFETCPPDSEDAQ